jgi:hypothetical protein
LKLRNKKKERKKFHSVKSVMKVQSGVGIYLYCFFNLGARYGLKVNATPQTLYPRERDPVSIL